MKTLTGKTRIAFLTFFATHIPATLCVDSQVIFARYYPRFLQNLLAWYCRVFNDDLMRAPHHTWFRAFVSGEIILQLPFFFVAVHMLWNNGYDKNYSNDDKEVTSAAGSGWFRSCCLIYGTHTATTLLPILACFILDNQEATNLQKIMVISIYLPYLVFPLWLVYIAFVSHDVFGKSRGYGEGSNNNKVEKVQ